MGSRVAEGLARMGVGSFSDDSVTIYDNDIFEAHNLVNQWVSYKSLGQSKAYTVEENMKHINPSINVQACDKAVNYYISLKELAGVVFLCVDSMAVRRDVVEGMVGNSAVRCVIETRMDAGVGVSHCFNPHNDHHLDCWRLYWFPDDEAENMMGCGGPQSIISAIYGTTTLALKQFESYARSGFSSVFNRIYYDFDECVVRSQRWDT
jgi:hypothetical protein